MCDTSYDNALYSTVDKKITRELLVLNMHVCKSEIDKISALAEPEVLEFPANRDVIEGERVEFVVSVTGYPPPRMTWYHNGEEVKGDYSIQRCASSTETIAQ